LASFWKSQDCSSTGSKVAHCTTLAGVLYVYGASDLIAIDIRGFNPWVALSTALALSALAWGLMGRWFWRRLQGFTGDCLGATQQVCELAFYLGLAVSL
jgi:adenosylcobinamide-GDP ribazoletransferase